MIVFLIGYMGSGKSLVGGQLAKILNYNFCDFDAYIEHKENASIQEIFNNKGEIYFRKAEKLYLEEIINLNNTVISLGGGTPCFGNNMAMILEAKNSATVYLKTGIPILVERLFKERSKRPLIAHLESKDELSRYIGKHLFERSFFYEQAPLSVKTDNRSANEITKAIVLQLGEMSFKLRSS
ncbi:MAG: shikimate kinase [Psychroserpens sp.]|uniref:shikimate kinase n=1 Tax=Psychroserpens sp. TaxID=2020870 RepID=UPI003CB7D901